MDEKTKLALKHRNTIRRQNESDREINKEKANYMSLFTCSNQHARKLW